MHDVQEIPIDLIDDNPFNSRMNYSEENLEAMKSSLAREGLLNAIKIRRMKDRYQIVYGHRRMKAARALNWTRIMAEVCDISDEQMCQLSLIENVAREDLSDYEKAISFSRLKEQFGRTCEEIGKDLGLSKQHVSNYISMLDLFDETALSRDPSLRLALRQITEHHARILSRIEDERARIDALRLVVLEGFSVRDLERSIRHLRSWFPTKRSGPLSRRNFRSARAKDIADINAVLLKEYTLPSTGDFKAFEKLHAFNREYSVFSAFPPMKRCESIEGLNKEKDWFQSVAPNFTIILRDVVVRLYENVAIATFYLDFQSKFDAVRKPLRIRGTLVLAYQRRKWRIVHGHFSAFDPAEARQYLETYVPVNLRRD